MEQKKKLIKLFNSAGTVIVDGFYVENAGKLYMVVEIAKKVIKINVKLNLKMLLLKMLK